VSKYGGALGAREPRQIRRKGLQRGERMIYIKSISGQGKTETSQHIEEALALAAQKAREGKRDYGLFSEGKTKPFASVSQLAWAWLYGKHF